VSILFGQNDEMIDQISSFDDEQATPPAISDQLTYWAVLFASACLTTLGIWKLVDLLL
tara:strand:+ start:1680 stop:1853 length:174 start_codon:yes stop_codon:yes gene_type:complete